MSQYLADEQHSQCKKNVEINILQTLQEYTENKAINN